MDWYNAILLVLNIAVGIRAIYIVIQVEKYRKSLHQLMTRMERVTKEPHP